MYFLFNIRNFFLLKNTLKVALQYLYNLFILFKTVYYFQLNLKLKIDPKMCTFKNMKKFGKPGIIKKKRVTTLIGNIYYYNKCTVKTNTN